MFLSASVPFFSSPWINVVLSNWNFRNGKGIDMQITLEGLHLATHPWCKWQGDYLSFPIPLSSWGHQPAANGNVHWKKIVDEYLSFMYLAPFCSSANSPNRQRVTKHWGHKAEQETQFIQQILAGSYCARHTALGAMGCHSAEFTQRPGPPGDTEPGGGAHVGSSCPRVICALFLFFKTIFQNRKFSFWNTYKEEIA